MSEKTEKVQVAEQVYERSNNGWYWKVSEKNYTKIGDPEICDLLTHIAQLEAERDAALAILLDAGPDDNADALRVVIDNTITALSKQEKPKKNYEVVKMECFIHGELNPEDGPDCPKCALSERSGK